MTINCRVIKNISRIDNDVISKYVGIPSANVGDVLNRMCNMNARIKSMNKKYLIGSAFTVKVPAGDNLFIHHSIDLAKEGDILVVNAESTYNRAVFGEMMLDLLEKKNIGGIIIDGCVRDINSIQKSNIPVFAIGVTAQGPYKNGPGEINIPIACGGQVVNPADLIIGDEDGIVVIPKDMVDVVLNDAMKKFESEKKEIKYRNITKNKKEILEKHELKFKEKLKNLNIKYY